MNTCIKMWKESKLWDRLDKVKKIFQEQKYNDANTKEIREYLDTIFDRRAQ